MDALGGGGAGRPLKRTTSPVENRTFFCHPSSDEKGSLKWVSKKSPSNGRRAKRRLILMSNPAPNIVPNAFSAPRGVQPTPEHPEIVTESACAPPNSACTNGVNLSPRKEYRGPNIYE